MNPIEFQGHRSRSFFRKWAKVHESSCGKNRSSQHCFPLVDCL